MGPRGVLDYHHMCQLLLSAFKRAFEALPVLLFTLLTIVAFALTIACQVFRKHSLEDFLGTTVKGDDIFCDDLCRGAPQQHRILARLHVLHCGNHHNGPPDVCPQSRGSRHLAGMRLATVMSTRSAQKGKLLCVLW
eukprot:2680273-Amphidinium_carterae.1